MPVHHEAQGAGDVTVHKIENMGTLGNNGYIVVCPETNQGVCIDTPAEPEKMINEVQAHGIDVQAILITHGHQDHLAGYAEITGEIGAPAAIGGPDAGLPPSPPQRSLSDGDTVTFGNRSIQCLSTPGHTEGSTCFLVGGFVFSGDTLFPGGPGRSRSPQALQQELNSISSKLLTLSDDTYVYPGHGPENTTIGEARRRYTVFMSKSHSADLQGDVDWLNT